ncbi:uncharacterized protein LOC131846594 [Achroia grisella]|uniref:uncharacterized protein LOC131846594 n=1 Tax=Achroia grisella TaxID=688607 RepID=UPI0027D225FE|nr:uncharacterized protein LOC131846594 [Achroia grisella]
MLCYCVFIIVTLFIPLPSNQHFIWPLSTCMLADLCNHTWIPECGREKDKGHLKLFTDECDLLEFSCDHDKQYELLNYSDCFTAPTSCPMDPPCPSNPTCPNHRFHRMGQHYVFHNKPRRMIRPPSIPSPSLPLRMLKGKTRYTPKAKMRRIKNVKEKVKKSTTMMLQIQKNKRFIKKSKVISNIQRKTIVLKKETLFRNGKKLIRVIKGLAPIAVTKKYVIVDSDYLEN